MSFQLPPNVTAQRKPISATSYEYILRHSELGQLGQILLSACTSGACKVTSLVYGQPGEQLTEQRRAVFEPLARSLAEQIQLTTNFPKAAKGKKESIAA
ncbi:MAG: hypothetical protein V4448_04400 [Pseudomonadota bacterium]